MEERIPIPDSFTVAHLDELRSRLPGVTINCTNGFVLIDAQHKAAALDALCDGILPVVQEVAYKIPPVRKVVHQRTVRNVPEYWVLSP